MNTILLLALLPFAEPEAVAPSGPTVVLVVGAAGTAEYGREFKTWADNWSAAAKRGGAQVVRIGSEKQQDLSDRIHLQAALQAAEENKHRELWLVLIGHGTFDGKTARFNLRGPDVSARDLATWLEPLKRPVAIVNCAAANGPFIDRLSRDDRVIVTATKSGSEQNFAWFGKFLSKSIGDSAADIEKDGQTSLLEAWLTASRSTNEFYITQGRLATEHSLLDDNGDQRGVRSNVFQGTRPIAKATGTAIVDGFRAHQFHLVPSAEERRLSITDRVTRNELELEIRRLRNLKPKLPPAEYARQLESLLVQLAKLYEQVESAK
jgi:hypothetical protein